MRLSCCADAKTYHTVLRLDRGCPWESALQARNAYIQECRSLKVPPSAKTGFYIDKKKHGKDGEPGATESQKRITGRSCCSNARMHNCVH